MRTGTYLNDKGYPRLSAGPERGKYVHILIAEAMLGRELRKDEVVHHKDGNRANCKWTNLLVIDEAVHNAVSARQYWYLKQKFSHEQSAWMAYFEVTGETADQAWVRQNNGILVRRSESLMSAVN